MPDSSSSALNPPKQPRSHRTLERIVGAALELLEAEGPDGVTVQAVVGKARSSVGSFYARFRGKDDLLEYLSERVWDDALSRWNEAVESHAWAEMTLAQMIEGSVGLLFDVRRSRVDHLRQLDRMAGGGDAYERFRRLLLESLEALLLERPKEMKHPDPQLAVRLGLRAVLGVLDSGPDAERERVVSECTDLLLGYLAGAAPERGSEPVEFFDVWG